MRQTRSGAACCNGQHSEPGLVLGNSKWEMSVYDSVNRDFSLAMILLSRNRREFCRCAHTLPYGLIQVSIDEAIFVSLL